LRRLWSIVSASRGFRCVVGVLLVVFLTSGCITEGRPAENVRFDNLSARTVELVPTPRSVLVGGRADGVVEMEVAGGQSAAIRFYDDGDNSRCNSSLEIVATVDATSVGHWRSPLCDGEHLEVTNSDLIARGVDVFAESDEIDAVLAVRSFDIDDWDSVQLPEDPHVSAAVTLERDLARGQIGVNEYARHGVLRWFEPGGVPDQYRLPAQDWAQRGALEEAIAVTLRVWPDLEPEAQEELGAFLRTISQYPSRMLPEGWTVRGPESP